MAVRLAKAANKRRTPERYRVVENCSKIRKVLECGVCSPLWISVDRFHHPNGHSFSENALMDAYLQRAKAELLAGIRAEYWLNFFKIFQEQRDPATIRKEIIRLREKVHNAQRVSSDIDPALTVINALKL